MHYRLYQPADFSALYAVEELCFEPPFRFSRAYMRQLIRNPESATWITEEDRELAGFAIIEWSTDSDDRAAYIQTLEVTPRYRGRGIGSELLHRIESSASAAGAAHVWLHVDTENSAAIRLYESQAYLRRGREEHYYARNRAAFIYSKALNSPAP